MKTNDLFLTNNSMAYPYIKEYTYPYQILPNIADIINNIISTLDNNYINKGNNIWIHNTAIIDDNVKIIGPCIIDAYSTIRHNAYIRGNVIIGKNTIIGNSCELKNSIIFDNAVIPHFNYVGDSIIGSNAHLSAGVITSNLRLDKKNIIIDGIETNLRKIGSFIGDNVEVGCNTVLNPGTVIGPNTVIYPLLSIKGVIPSNSIIKDNHA